MTDVQPPTTTDLTLSELPNVSVNVESMLVHLTINLAPAGLTERLSALIDALTTFTTQGEVNMGRMEDAVERMRLAVEKNTEVDGSVKVLLADLATQLRANMNNPAAIEALAVKLESDNAGLADAVVANTDVASGSSSGGGSTGGGDTSGGGTGGSTGDTSGGSTGDTGSGSTGDTGPV